MLSKKDKELIEAATQAISRRYRDDWQEVGAAMRTRDGRIVTGVNIDAYIGRIAVCAEAIANQGSDFDPEVVVLTRSGADNLCNQLYSLTDVIEQLGGRTEYTEARKRAAAQGGHAS